MMEKPIERKHLLHESHFKTRDDLELFYRFWLREKTDPVFLIIHGFGEHSLRYLPMADELAGLPVSIAIFDLRGHGKSDGERVYVLSSSGIHKIDLSDKKTVPLVIKKSDEWGAISSMVSFGGNLYLLDTQKSRIWKYIATDKGFSELREYLNPDTILDLTNATGMAIDGSVWIGTKEGKIVRFTQGKENTFIIQGVEPDLGKDLTVYTSDEVKNIYILDRQDKRIVMLDKDGLYQAQYSWTGNIFPSAFFVSEELKKIFLLIDGKFYSIDLT